MALRLQRWSLGDPAFEVRDGAKTITGRISAAFKTWLDLSYAKIEDQEDRQDAIDAELQDTVAALEVTVAALEAVTAQTATLTGQMSGLLTHYVPLIDAHTADIATINSRLAAAGIP